VCGGIEELSDYTLVTKGKKSGKVLKRPLSCPKKSTLTADGPPPKKVAKKNVFNVVETENIVPKEDKVKPKKKEKKKVKGGNKAHINLAALNVVKTNKANRVEKSSSNSSTINETSKETKSDLIAIKQDDTSDKAIKIKSKKTVEKKKEKKSSVEESTQSVPLSQMGEWRDLFVSENIIKVLAEKGFKTPTPIQRMTLQAALKGRMDIVGAAETGSGKTLAFGIPIIQGILQDRKHDQDNPEENLDNIDESKADEENDIDINNVNGYFPPDQAVNVLDNVEFDFAVADDVTADSLDVDYSKPTRGDKLRAVVLTPTRELALQVYKHIAAISECGESPVGVMVVVGGLSVEKQIRLLARRPSVIVATPGRLWDLMQEGNPHLSDLSGVKYLAIDETDRMVEKGHFEELQKLLEKLNSAETKNANRQTFIMSATLSLVHKKPAHVKKKQMTPEQKLAELIEGIGVKQRRKVVDITRKVGTAETLSESAIHCPTTEKDYYLYYFVKSHPGRTVVFCNSIDCVRRLANLFALLDVNPLPLHAQLHQKQRLKNLDRFSGSKDGLLIATDVAARGLDIPNIEHVIHYQVPRTSESYIHRSGRTARATRRGLSILLIDPSEQVSVKKLCTTLGRDKGLDSLPVFPVELEKMGRVRERLNIARKLDKLLLDNRKQTAGDNWKQKTAEEADLVISDEDEEEVTYQGRKKTSADIKNLVTQVRWQLQESLRTPLTQLGYGGAYPTMSGSVQTSEVTAKREEKAVEVLENNLQYTKKLLRGNKKTTDKRDKFKGFKKRKKQQK